jgi:hypothetical protein
MTYHGEARNNLERLPSEVLFNLARNPAAVERKLAIQLLVERGSEFACRDEIALEAEQFVLDNPRILAKIDPVGAVMAASRLPGIVDVICAEQERRRALAATVDEHHAIHGDKHSALESTVAANRDAGELALRTAYSVLWRDATTKIFALKTEHDKVIAELRADHDAQIADAQGRLTLLERSAWKKVSDWLRARWARLRKPKAVPALTEKEEGAAFSERVAEMVRNS